MFQYVALTDGTTTIDLTDTINYALVSYAPVVPTLRDSELASEGSYDTVAESITVHAIGCTAADAYAAAGAVNLLLDQARRWWNGANVSAVTLVIQVQDSTTTLRGVVKGRAPGGTPGMALQATWSEFYGKYLVQNIAIQFLRRGPWVRSSESLTIASGANPSATVLSANFTTNVTDPCYLSLSAVNISSAITTNVTSVYLFWHKTAANLQVIEAESIPDSGSGRFSVVADAAALARGGSVLRFIGSSGLTDWVTQNPLVITTSCKRAVVYAAVRSNSNAKTFGVGVICTSSSGAGANNDPSEARTYWRATTANNPEIIPIGMVSVRYGIGAIIIECSSEALTTERMDIDYLILLGVDDDQSGVLALGSFSVHDVVLATPGTDQLALDMLFDPRADTTARVQLRNTTTGYIAAKTYSGDPIAQHSGQNLTCCIVGCTSTYWRIYDSVAVALDNIGFESTRYLTNLVPS